jgi:hypothetical protein
MLRRRRPCVNNRLLIGQRHEHHKHHNATDHDTRACHHDDHRYSNQLILKPKKPEVLARQAQKSAFLVDRLPVFEVKIIQLATN